ncbi:MAG: type II secretion system protein J [Blastopirellula sp. JB062]
MIQTSAPRFARRGLTLVEMLVATTLTLILFFSVAQIFAFLGDTMHDARSTIELSGNLRGLTTTMQTDLDCHTAPGLPWLPIGANQGYFTLIEGPDRDLDFAKVASMAGDADDVLAFTAYSKDQPFVGLINGQLQRDPDGILRITNPTGPTDVSPITSHYAEILYWTEFTPYDDTNGDGNRDADETVTLFRRVLLIRPDIDFSQDAITGDPKLLTYLETANNYDLSVRPVQQTGAGYEWATNSLEDLQSRQNRHGSWRIGSISDPSLSLFEFDNLNDMAARSFPYPLVPSYLRSFEKIQQIAIDGGLTLRDRTGEDVVMAKVLAFDVKAFDPAAPILVHSTNNDIAAIPGDVGFLQMDENVTTDATLAGRGAFVDLDWDGLTYDPSRGTQEYDNGHFYGTPSAKSQLAGQTVTITDNLRVPTVGLTARNIAVYDTWPMRYESDGLNQDYVDDGVANINTPPFDEGTNGIDDDNANGVDDPGERETAPPYDHPLRGIQITIRAIEDGSRLIRQDTVTANLMTE